MAPNQEKKKENNFNFDVSFSNSQSSNLDEQELDKTYHRFEARKH